MEYVDKNKTKVKVKVAYKTGFFCVYMSGAPECRAEGDGARPHSVTAGDLWSLVLLRWIPCRPTGDRHIVDVCRLYKVARKTATGFLSV